MTRKATKRQKIVVRVLGATEIRVGQRQIELKQEGLFALALYMTTRAGELVSREELLEVFWPTGKEEDRRHAMRQMFYRLRQVGVCPDDHGECLTLPPELVDSDLLDALRARIPDTTSLSSNGVAPSLSPAFTTRMASGFLDWYDDIRSQLGRKQILVAQHRINSARREGRWLDQDRWARVILTHDPLNEEATMARAESASMLGSKVKAIELLDAYLTEVGNVAADIGRPAALLRKRIAEKRPSWTAASGLEVPLVGRALQMAQLTAAIEAASKSQGYAIALSGPPGIGKSRLANEAAEIALLRGARVLRVRGDGAGLPQPLGIVRNLVTSLVELPGALGCSPQHLHLLRELTEHVETAHPPTAHELAYSCISRALIGVLSAVSSAVRLAIIVDDGHHVDIASREVLEPCIATSGLRVTWIVTSRTSDQRWLPADAKIQVPPMDPKESIQLADRLLLQLGAEGGVAMAERIARIAGGNPLFAREIAAHLASEERGATSVPSSLQEAIRARISTLPESGMRLLRVVALLGRFASIERSIAAAGLGAAEGADVIDRLEREGMIHLDSTKNLSLHECWMQEVVHTIPAAAEAALCHSCAAVLTSSPAELDHEELSQAGRLYARAASTEQARSAMLKAVDQLLARGLLSEASLLLTEIRSLPISRGAGVALIAREAEVFLAKGDAQSALSVCSDLPATASDARRLGAGEPDWALAVALKHDALCKMYSGEAPDVSQLESVIRCEMADPMVRHYAAFIGARAALWADDIDELERYYRLATEITAATRRTLTFGFVELLFLGERGGRDAFLQSCRQQSLLEGSFAPLRHIRQSRRFKAIGMRMHGMIDEAAQLLHDEYSLSVDLEQRELAAGCAETLAFLFLDQGLTEEALKWVERGLEMQGEGSHALRRKGLRHAFLRAQLQEGRPDVVVAQMRAEIDAIQEDSLRSRRIGELLTFCVAAIQSGEGVGGILPILDAAAAELVRIIPSFQLDYPAEMLIRAYSLLSHPRGAEVHQVVVRRRRDSFDRPLAPFYSHLNKNNDFPLAIPAKSSLARP